MGAENKNILAVNGGSSSIKFSLYGTGPAADHRPVAGEQAADGNGLVKLLSGKIERIGLENTSLTFKDIRNKKEGKIPVNAADLPAAAAFLLEWLGKQGAEMAPSAVGHRVVHGMHHTEAVFIDDGLLEELGRISAVDPDHLPGEIELIRQMRIHAPGIPQIACFDTAFHQTMPRVAKLLPIPRRYADEGIQRYGFHGLSYAYIVQELDRVAGPAIAGGAVIIAHLGNGASLAAVRDGHSVDTTMGFTPSGGIVMGTRPGDLDPGVLWYILNKERYTPEQLDHFINQECGLLGLSGSTSDMQDLLARESSDVAAAEAVELFCYSVKKAIGAFAAVLGGLEALVFTGGIGEKAASIRSRICSGLGYLGVGVDQRANGANEEVITAAGSRTPVYVIPTDEESMIARAVMHLIQETFK